MNKQFKLSSAALVLAMSLITLGQVSAEEAAKDPVAKPVKAMTCKQKAKKIKDKKERAAFVKECKANKAEKKK